MADFEDRGSGLPDPFADPATDPFALAEQAAGVIAERTGVPVTIANPFARMSTSSRVRSSSLANDAPALMIATGLALRSFD